MLGTVVCFAFLARKAWDDWKNWNLPDDDASNIHFWTGGWLFPAISEACHQDVARAIVTGRGGFPEEE